MTKDIEESMKPEFPEVWIRESQLFKSCQLVF
jgi:hypothetical protein